RLRRLVWRPPDRRLPARPGRALALSDPRGSIRDLSLLEALDLALARLARRGGRPRAGRRLGCQHGATSVAGLGSGRRRCALGCGLRPLLLALRPRGRPRTGTPFVRCEVRRAEALL